MISLYLATSQEKKQWKLKQSVIGSNVSELLEVSVKQLFPNCEADPPGGTESHCRDGADSQGKCVVERSEHKVCRRGKECTDGTLFYLHFSFDPLNYKEEEASL